MHFLEAQLATNSQQIHFSLPSVAAEEHIVQADSNGHPIHTVCLSVFLSQLIYKARPICMTPFDEHKV